MSDFPHRYLSGTVSYRDVATDRETGREAFDITEHAQGRILRARCEMDAERLVRDVALGLDAQGRPTDALVRVTLDGVLQGSSWFWVEDGLVTCEAATRRFGRVSQRLPWPGRLPYLGLHPLLCDGLAAASRGTADPGRFAALPGITCSTSPAGETDLIGIPMSIDVAFVAAEPVAVPAGRFAALHYQLRWKPDWPPADLWVRAEDGLFLRLDWSHVGATHVLTGLDEHPQGGRPALAAARPRTAMD